MNKIFKKVCKLNGTDEREFMAEIKKAQRLCNMDGVSEAEFIKTLTLMALREYLDNENTTAY